MDQVVGTATTYGSRPTNEDMQFHCIINPAGLQLPHVSEQSILYCGLFDGHGGMECVDYVANNFHKHLHVHEDLEELVYNAYETINKEVQYEASRRKFDGGTTSAIVLIRGDKLVVANTGDTKVVLCRQGRARLLSEMHLAGNKIERKRSEELGGTILTDAWGTQRVGGVMMVTRTIGPIQERIKGLTWKPYITTLQITDEDSFVVLGTDGVFNVMNNQEAVDIVKYCPNPEIAADKIVQKSLEYRTDDNATCSVVRLHGWGKYREVDYTNLLKIYNFKIFGTKIDFPENLIPLIIQQVPKHVVVRALYDMFDQSHDGTLSRSNFKRGMKMLDSHLTSEDLDVVLSSINTGTVLTFDDFSKIL
uniref:PPM-type phosphatase domain-containing protein n=1 Tax=Arcella intermedia TaxID=1963864 RepID=A0A6B2L7N9_9EUKA